MTDSTAFAEIDLADPDTFVDAVPHDAFAWLRREDPVHFNPEADGPGFWVVTRYEDIRTVHRDVETFSSELGGIFIGDLEPDQLAARKSIIDSDPPRHDELRAPLNPRFTPRAVTSLEQRMRTITADVLDRALPLGEFDFVEHVSSEIPMQVFAELMGIPEEERRHVVELGNQLIGGQDPEFDEPDEESRLLPLGHPASREVIELGRKLAAARRAEPGEDLVSLLVFEGLTQQEYDVNFLLLAVAGNETTRHTITHGMLALLENPDQLERLRADPELFRFAGEEMLRWATPIHYQRRTASRDTELGGTAIAAGEKVTTWLGSGNRDEAYFPDPDMFDVGRTPNRQMAFGPGGIHHCLGAPLARLEVRVVFEELLGRAFELELAGPPERLRSNAFNGIKRLPVRVA